jgi:hypothetical protein
MVKSLEDLRSRFFCDPWTIVVHPQRNVTRRHEKRHLDQSNLTREFTSVIEQNTYEFVQEFVAGDDEDCRFGQRLELQRRSSRSRDDPEAIARVSDDRSDVGALELARLDGIPLSAREPQKLFDDSFKAFSLVSNALEGRAVAPRVALTTQGDVHFCL